jgi:hypothetical protein
MSRRWIAVVFLFSLMTISAVAARQGAKPPAGSASGWTLPPEAQTTKSPLTVDPKLLATGKSIFKEKCQKCHGASGKGDGPDADPDAQEDMDLTRAERAAKNPRASSSTRYSTAARSRRCPLKRTNCRRNRSGPSSPTCRRFGSRRRPTFPSSVSTALA